jgi:dipeptidyl aminopeptidase/acylaminoacyl peptidase
MRQVVEKIAKGVAVACLAAAATTMADAAQDQATVATMRPIVSEDAVPLETVAPATRDGNRAEGFLRKPPGAGPFPAVVLIHGGITRWPSDQLRQYALGTWASRFLAVGYVVVPITYRSRDIDPQSTDALEDVLAIIEHLRRFPYVDRNSIVVNGTSGGGDLALSVAGATQVAAIVAEEPASSSFMGIFNKQSPKKGDRYTAQDTFPIHADPKRYFTPQYQQVTREKIARIVSPMLIILGDRNNRLNTWNQETLLPELRRAGKTLEVIEYPGEPHSFAFYSEASRTPRPAVAARAFEDTDAFLRRHLRIKPKPIDARVVKQVPF